MDAVYQRRWARSNRRLWIGSLWRVDRTASSHAERTIIMRKQPEVSPPEAITAKQPDNVITQIREYQLITPLYGGGVKPTEPDPITVVRATEIRGQLRFWWRACRGGEFNGKLGAMKEEE